MRTSGQFSEWVEQYTGSLPHGTALAPDRTLAAQWGLSTRTVSGILAGFGRTGRLLRIPGKGTFVNHYDTPPEAAAPTAVARPPLDLAGAIEDAINRGEIRRGEALPSVKFVCRQFHVGSATVTAAYRSLCHRGLAVKIGKTYWAGTFATLMRAPTPRTVRIIFTSQGELERVFRYETKRSSLYRTFEDVLCESGIRVSYNFIADLPRLHRRWRTDPGAAPFALLFYDLNDNKLLRLDDNTRALLNGRSRLPTKVLIDWRGGPHRTVRKVAAVFSHSNSETTKARALARFVHERGYKASVYFMAGLAEEGLGMFFTYLRFRAELRHLNPAAQTRLVLNGERGRLLDRVPVHIATNLLSKYERVPFASMTDETVQEPYLEDAFEKYRSLGLWVMQLDRLASHALEWTHLHGIAVPRGLGIVTLENNPAYYHLGLSRCEVDWENVGYLLAHAAIGDLKPQRTTKGYLRVRARVVEKLTTP